MYRNTVDVFSIPGPMKRRTASVFLLFALLLLASPAFAGTPDENGGPDQNDSSPDQPNIVILFADDLGYGDLSSFGNPQVDTRHLDRLAERGVRFRSFYTGNWCVPSRVQLMTGRYRARGMLTGRTGVDGNGGISDRELTLAEGLKKAGYATGMTGKWHLGYGKKKYLPTNKGFDSWFGLPYSNDMRKPWVQTDEPLGLYRGTEMVEHPIDQDTLTVRYTEEAVRFISNQENGGRPFFFYLAYNMPHLPIHTSERFRGQSNAGLYGDVIETIDWSVGRVLETLKKQGLRNDTIVFFASDNGPWLDLPDRMLQEGNKRWHAGSPGPFRGHKGTTYEGGHRVPAIIHWPGHIAGGRTTSEIVSSTDMYRTFLNAGGGTEPDQVLDGYDLMPFLTGTAEASPRSEYHYFRGNTLEAIRSGPWKLRLANEKPQLFRLRKDPGERFNRAEERPDKIKELRRKMRQKAAEFRSNIHIPD